MGELHLTDVLNNGMVFKFYVPVEDCPGIESFVDNYVRVTLSGTLDCIGSLTKVTTWSKKEKGTVVAIYKEITLLIESISSKEGEVRFPDKKDSFVEDFTIVYITK